MEKAFSTNQFFPEVQKFVENRLAIEMQAIDLERSRLNQQMNDEIESAKQRRLSEIASRMQEILESDSSNANEYQALAPALYTKYSLKHPRRKAKKLKTKLPKLSAKDPLLKKTDILYDLSLAHPTSNLNMKKQLDQDINNIPQKCKLSLNSGQKWMVETQPAGENLIKLTFCDGSHSFLHQTEQSSYGLKFEPIN